VCGTVTGSLQAVQRPAGPLLVYDGDCGFCTASAAWISQRWPDGSTAAAVPSQALDDGELERLGLTGRDVARSAWWVDGDGRLGGHRAVAAALAASDGPWRTAGRLLAVPPLSWIGAAVYRAVARHRHRLPGATPSCTPAGR
jgi:predicted DCC family thiol-disulfide oxidoreductase YuxK